MRFLCPAIASPEIADLCKTSPSKSARVVLTIVSKVIQNMSNGTLMKAESGELQHMNDFITSQYVDEGERREKREEKREERGERREERGERRGERREEGGEIRFEILSFFLSPSPLPSPLSPPARPMCPPSLTPSPSPSPPLLPPPTPSFGRSPLTWLPPQRSSIAFVTPSFSSLIILERMLRTSENVWRFVCGRGGGVDV